MINTERFRTVSKIEDFGEWGECETIHLEVRLPYKNCFGINKVYYKSVLYMDLNDIIKKKLSTKKEVLEYLIALYQERRALKKCERHLRKNFNI